MCLRLNIQRHVKPEDKRVFKQSTEIEGTLYHATSQNVNIWDVSTPKTYTEEQQYTSGQQTSLVFKTIQKVSEQQT